MNDSASLLAEEARTYYDDLLRPVFSGRKFLLVGPVAAGLRKRARQLTALGAARPFLIAATKGTGPLPPSEEAELRVIGIKSKNPIEEFRSLQRVMDSLPADLQSDIDAWDPPRTARSIIESPPIAEPPDAAGRKAYAARPATWAALEDKVRIDAFWDAEGVMRVPSRIVPADELLAEAQRIAEHLAGFAPFVPRTMKAMVNFGMEASLSGALMLEKYAQGALVQTDDKTEGISAFLEKRKPEFKGR